MVAINEDFERTRRRIAFVEEVLNPEDAIWSKEERGFQLTLLIESLRRDVRAIDALCEDVETIRTSVAYQTMATAIVLYATYYELSLQTRNLAVVLQLESERKAGRWLTEFAPDLD